MYLLIDKPKGITSHDVVDELRKITGIKRIGHAGTLDPNATGLLIVGVGRSATKELGKITKNTEKTYLAEIYLGEERDTDDAEGKILRFASLTQDDNSGVPIIPSLSKVKIVLHKFIGEQEQVPPVYSAIKIKGRKAYELARRSISLSLSPRKIIIYKIKLLEYKFPILKIETVVSSGTYIRALARDIGKKLGTGAYLRNLRRTKIGHLDLGLSVKIDILTNDNLKEHLVSFEQLK